MIRRISRKTEYILIGLFAAILIAVLLLLWRSHNKSKPDALPPLTTTILKVGKADAIVIREGAHTMLIDCGEEDDGQEVIDFLTTRNIEKVDVLIITHYDKDHVGGADQLIEQIPVERILLPDYKGASTEYFDFVAAMKRANLTPEVLTDDVTFSFGSAEVLVSPSHLMDHEEATNAVAAGFDIDNNLSLITMMTHGQNRMLFTGDAEKERIREWCSSDNAKTCAFLKLPHHGVYNTALAELLETVKPQYSVICDSAKNPASADTLETLKLYGVDVLETKNGKITITSDGIDLYLKQKVK